MIDGCSKQLSEVLGEAGHHACAAVGMGSLPLGVVVEIEAIAIVKAQWQHRPRIFGGKGVMLALPSIAEGAKGMQLVRNPPHLVVTFVALVCEAGTTNPGVYIVG